MIIAETSTFIYSHSCAATCEHFEQYWNGKWFPAKALTALPFYRKRKSCAFTRRIFLFFCRRARLLELLHKIDFRFRILVLIFSHFWKLLLKALDKHIFFYMILYLQVFLTYTIQLYTYQRVFRDQKLNMKNFLTDGSSPTVHLYFFLNENFFISKKFISVEFSTCNFFFRKSLGHSQIQKISRQKWLSPKLDT